MAWYDVAGPTVRRQTTRAFRVSRDKVTGKQKMIPMDESELDGMMSRGGPAGIKDANYFQKLKDKLGGGKRKGGSSESEEGGGAGAGAPSGPSGPKGLGGLGVGSQAKAKDLKVVDVGGGGGEGASPEEDVADMVMDVVNEVATEEQAAEQDDSKSKSTSESKSESESSDLGFSLDPLDKTVQPVSPEAAGRQQGGASPAGSMMFNAAVKQFFDGFRSRVTLLTACLCYVTAPGMNLWAPIAGGLTADLLFIVYQRNCMNRFLAAGGVELAPGAGPATPEQIRQAQMKLLKQDLDRRRRALAGQLMVSAGGL